MKKTTESESEYKNLEKLSTKELINIINHEDKKVANSVHQILPQIENFIEACFNKMKNDGRLFYIGAGTSGRLGILDASECPPTFGVDYEKVIGIIAGGDKAIRKAVEFAEDNSKQGWEDLKKFNFSKKDTLVGIAASGTTPYVIGAIKEANKIGAITGGITCNPKSTLSLNAKFPMTPIVGSEVISGSTRMKSGTAQKLILNMISTSLMIKLGHVQGNKMIDMQLSNNKLIERGTKMIMSATHLNFKESKQLLLKHGSVRKAIDYNKN